MSKQLSLRDHELLSAYLDGQLSDSDRNSVEQNLKIHGEWQLALDELDQTRRVLRRAPRYRAPRSFALTPEMAKQARRSFLTNLIGLRVSAAMATLALIAALVMQGSPLLANTAASPMLAAAPASEALTQDAAGAVIMEAAPVEKSAEDAAAEATPMIITWGEPSGVSGMGGGADSAPMDLAAPAAPKVPEEQAAPTQTAPAAGERTAAESETAIEGSGPILGVPSNEQAGQFLATSEEPNQFTAEDMQSAPKDLISLRAFQLGLLALAVVAGVTAIIFARRHSA